MKVMIDTGILIGAWDSANKKKQSLALETLSRYKKEACISVQSLSEFAAVMIAKGCDSDWLNRVIVTYGKLMDVLPLRTQDIGAATQAVQHYQLSWWDAQLWAVAASHDVSLILSEDGPAGREVGGVRFHNPFVGK